MFIGREKELSDMNRMYQENRFHLFILYGRRRVGKTTLLKEFCKDKDSIFYSAEQSNEKNNLDKFSEQVFLHYGESNLQSFRSWESAFLYIDERQIRKPLVLVLDEFPYLADINPSLLSILQHLIDHKLQEGNLFLVLCGSYMGFMENEVLGSKSPLFGRRTAQLKLKTFDYKTSALFLQNFTKEEQLELYGAFGGTAMYLRQIDPDKTVKDNIINAFFQPTGYLYEEALLLLQQEVQEPGIYTAIIEAVAQGASKSNEIAQKTGENAAKCLKYIKTLRELGIIYREVPLGGKSTSRKAVYRVSDQMFGFWYRYVLRNKTLLETGAQEIVWERRVKPDYNHYMGTVFERICRDYLLHKNSRGELPLLFTEIGRWWGTDKKTHRQVEVDLIARDHDDYIFGECKWRNEKLNFAIYEDLKKKAEAFGHKQDKIYYCLFSKNGFTDTVINEALKDDRLLLMDLNDILSD